MNSSNATDAGRVTSGETRSTSARKPEMFTWQGIHEPRLEQVRLLMSSDQRLRASGRLVAAGPDEQFNASFEVSVGESGQVTRLLLRTATVLEERQCSLSRTEDGAWLVDHGQGSKRETFNDALDVDVQFAVLFNAIPIRRLGLHREPGEHALPVVRVSLPDLSVRAVTQTYKTVSVADDVSVVRFKSGGFEQNIKVDANGLVVEYPLISKRI
ncbi:putative glycolipid-binding domain-containing protein [Lentzea sp. CC55]|uniref:putative glycolipid-binding domain-containing protein n=1 Tax=Lentzea sp. CC55 TaxID=2884909 RepID=UPI0027E09955|nr:putative glycolipid-binding domain-containing protein [Lentzea sp. CC55]MCG8922084.1 putative glycolipid-binding domain-containing protein [Lentzea sp. CC55]